MPAGIKANSDGSAAIQVGGTDVITLTSGGAATFVTSPTTVQAGTAAAPSITFSGDTNTGIYSPGADTIAFTEGGVESGRFDSSGRLLLGTTTATNNLRLNEKFSIVTAGNNTYTGAAFVGYSGTADANSCPLLELQRSRGTTDGSFTAVASGDRLGVVTFRGADGVAWQDAAYVIGACDGTPTSNTSVPGRLIFATAASGSPTPTERARITSGGDLFVGNTTAVWGEAVSFQRGSSSYNSPMVGVYTTATGYTSVMNYWQTETASGTGWQFLNCRSAAGTQRLVIFGNGNVQNSNGSYGTLSDIKLKENIVDATPKLEKLQQVRIVNFNLIGDTQKQIGVIAQELEEVFPGLVEDIVDKDDEGNDLGTVTKSVKMSVFVPMLIKAIQEQQAMIDEMKAEIAALKGNA